MNNVKRFIKSNMVTIFVPESFIKPEDAFVKLLIRKFLIRKDLIQRTILVISPVRTEKDGF